MKRFRVTEDYVTGEWFSTFKEALDYHHGKSGAWGFVIEVYVDDQNIGDVCYNPTLGYYPVGYIDREYVDRFAQYGVHDEIHEAIS